MKSIGLALAVVSCRHVGHLPPWWDGVEPMHAELACERKSNAASEQPEARRRFATGGHRDPKEIQTGVRARFSTLRRCYEELMARVSAIEGRVAVRFVINDAGNVVQACIWDTDLRDQKFSTCFLDEFRAMRFGESMDPHTTVLYPIELLVLPYGNR